jgi:hypothetical protein
MNFQPLTHPTHSEQRLPPLTGWLWCALFLVVYCDTNVFARLVAGQVAFACDPWSEPPAEDESKDDPEARETPPLPAGQPLRRCPRANGDVTAVIPLAALGAGGHLQRRASGPMSGLPSPSVPLHGRGALPLRC